MRKLLRQFFGDSSDNVLIIHVDGKDWALAKDVCNLMGIGCEYHAVYDHISGILNLSDEDKFKCYVPEVHRKCPVWFISKSGFWKILGRSNSEWAKNLRAIFFTAVLPQIFDQTTIEIN